VTCLVTPMSVQSRSVSPRPVADAGKKKERDDESEAIHIKNLSRNVGESHLRAIFGCYGDISKVNIPTYFKCMLHFAKNGREQCLIEPLAGQSKGTATITFYETSAAAQAISHMDGGSIDGLGITVESIYVSTHSPSPPRSPRLRSTREDIRSRKNNSRSPARSWSRSRSRSPPRRRPFPGRARSQPFTNAGRESRGGRRLFTGPRRSFKGRSRSRSRSYSPLPRRSMRRRSPSYERGGLTRGDRRERSFSRSLSRSRSPYSARSSRSRTKSWSSRSRSRSRSYTPVSSHGRTASSRSRSRSPRYNRESKTRSVTPNSH
jgi:RNA-binding protein with serine-rich domain 1